MLFLCLEAEWKSLYWPLGRAGHNEGQFPVRTTPSSGREENCSLESRWVVP